MALSFLCPHCSQLFEADPDMFGQARACNACGGLFTVPEPQAGEGFPHVPDQGDSTEALAASLKEKEILSKEMESLRERLSSMEREFSEMVIERQALREQVEESAKVRSRFEVDSAQTEKVLAGLQSELETGKAALKIAEERGDAAARNASLLEQKLSEGQAIEQRLSKSLKTIEVLKADCDQNAKALALEKSKSDEFRAGLKSSEEAREVLLREMKQVGLEGAQLKLRLSESEEETRVLTARLTELNVLKEECKVANLKLKEVEFELRSALQNEQKLREEIHQQHQNLKESQKRIAELDEALVKSNARSEARPADAKWGDVQGHEAISILERGGDSASDSARLVERVNELEEKLRHAGEKEIELNRQLTLKGEELASMHRRLLQSDHGDRAVPEFGGVLPDLLQRIHQVLLIVEVQIARIFSGFAAWDRSRRLAVSIAVCLALAFFLCIGVFRVSAIFRNREYEPSADPGDLVHVAPVLREIEEAVPSGEIAQPPPQKTELSPMDSSDLVVKGALVGSGSEGSIEVAVPTTQALKPMVESDGSDNATRGSSTDSAVGVASSAVVPETPVVKEAIKNLSRSSLPNQFLGTQFGTAISEVANLSNWTESNGRLRRKATLVGASVEAVLIPDHENRVMAGAYVRVCPRSTDSLAQFLEWAVGVQDAVDAEYGEPSAVHEISEAEDAAAVVERIANGKDFYEATWERQNDDGLIVLSIRVYNERSVVFRLEYMNRQLLAQYTAQQRNADQPEPKVEVEN